MKQYKTFSFTSKEVIKILGEHIIRVEGKEVPPGEVFLVPSVDLDSEETDITLSHIDLTVEIK